MPAPKPPSKRLLVYQQRRLAIERGTPPAYMALSRYAVQSGRCGWLLGYAAYDKPEMRASARRLAPQLRCALKTAGG